MQPQAPEVPSRGPSVTPPNLNPCTVVFGRALALEASLSVRAAAHEPGYPNPVSARERIFGSKTEMVQQNSKRQGDLGISGVLGADSVALIGLTVSDGGGSKPGPNYVPGDHCQRNATTKCANYVGDNACFTGILEKQLIVPS